MIAIRLIFILQSVFCWLRISLAVDESTMDPITWKICPPARTDIREGASVTLRCEAKIELEVPNSSSYRWETRRSAGQFSFHRLKPSSKYRYDPTGQLGDLHIRSVDRDDTGQRFHCLRGPHMANKLTRCANDATLRVFWLNPNVTVQRLQPPATQPLSHGNRVVLLCDVKSSEPPTLIKWFFNAAPIEYNGGSWTQQGPQLIIASLSDSTSGVYHCYVEATGGRVLTPNPLALFYGDMSAFFTQPVIYARIPEERAAAAVDKQEPVELRVDLPPGGRYAVTWFALTAFGNRFAKQLIASDDS